MRFIDKEILAKCREAWCFSRASNMQEYEHPTEAVLVEYDLIQENKGIVKVNKQLNAKQKQIMKESEHGAYSMQKAWELLLDAANK